MWKTLKPCAAALSCLLLPAVAAAQTATCNDFGHFDVFVDVDANSTDSERLRILRDNPFDPNASFPLDFESRSLLVPADFGDFGGGPHKTDDPGWVIETGNLAANELLWFRALGTLDFWNTATGQWQSAPPAGERLRFFGAIPPEVFLNGDPDELAFYQQGTIWSANGLEGPTESAIEQASGDGTIHSHLDFCIEDSTGDCSAPGIGQTGSPAVGAYLIELELFSDAVDANGDPKYADSAPVKVVLNNGLVAEECAAAIEALTQPAADQGAERETPASGILILNGE
ncbi:MAG: hypothetical protein AAFN78_10965 [Pseudomonadota bacterium]